MGTTSNKNSNIPAQRGGIEHAVVSGVQVRSLRGMQMYCVQVRFRGTRAKLSSCHNRANDGRYSCGIVRNGPLDRGIWAVSYSSSACAFGRGRTQLTLGWPPDNVRTHANRNFILRAMRNIRIHSTNEDRKQPMRRGK